MKILVIEVVVAPHVGDRCYRAVAMNDGFIKALVIRSIGVKIAQVPFAEDARAISIGCEHVCSGGSLS